MLFDWMEYWCCSGCFLADSENVDSVVMINPFYKRSEVLKLRNIYCDEEVCIENTTKQPVNYVIIAGVQDDKIPYTESLNVANIIIQVMTIYI